MSARQPHTPNFWLRTAAALLLLGIFGLGQLGPWLAHYLVHTHAHHRTHNLEQEQDPCHRATFHLDFSAGCPHPTHLSAPELSCDLSQFLLVTHTFALALLHTPTARYNPHVPSYRPSFAPAAYSTHHFVRGPPQLA